MKHKFILVFPFVFLLTGFLTLSMGGGVASASSRLHSIKSQVQILSQSAKGVSFTGASSSKVVNPNISRMNCSGGDYFTIWTDFEANEDCFAYSGTMAVGLYYADQLWTGNNTGEVSFIYNNTLYKHYFLAKDSAYCILYDNAGECNFVYVYSITIY